MTTPEPHMFVRAQIFTPGGAGAWFDVAIADISAIQVPAFQGAPHPLSVIVGGLVVQIAAQSYEHVHAVWVARRRSAAGR